MQGISGTSKSGAKFYYYSCKNRRKRKCTMRNKKKDLLEKIVLKALKDIVHAPAYRFMIADAYYKMQNDDGGAYEVSIKS